MKKLVLALLIAVAMFPQPLLRAADKQKGDDMPKVGDLAPDFKLQYLDASGLKDISLSQYRGQKQVVLAFYVFAFTGG